MKILDRIGLALFSVLILILSVILCLMIFGWLDVNMVFQIVKAAITNEIASNTLLALSGIFILLALKCIFFESVPKKENDYNYKSGILLENSDGKLLITKETLENLVNGVVKSFKGTENIETKLELDKDNTVIVYVNMNIKDDVIIKDLSSNLQTKVKETIKRTSDLEVKEVNIQIKNTESVKEA